MLWQRPEKKDDPNYQIQRTISFWSDQIDFATDLAVFGSLLATTDIIIDRVKNAFLAPGYFPRNGLGVGSLGALHRLYKLCLS